MSDAGADAIKFEMFDKKSLYPIKNKLLILNI